MNGNGYKLLGFVVWNAGKWYLRRRLPSPRRVLLTGLIGAGTIGALAFVLRRAAA